MSNLHEDDFEDDDAQEPDEDALAGNSDFDDPESFDELEDEEDEDED